MLTFEEAKQGILALQLGGGENVLAIQGYFDGTMIKPLEKIAAKPNQRVIITIMDEFVEPEGIVRKKGMRGILAQYANSSLTEKEKGAWERATVNKYGNV